MDRLGEKLKEFRIEKEWNQSQMADYLDISVRTYYDIEKTGAVKKNDVLAKIFNKTGIKITQLIANEEGATYLKRRNDIKNNGKKSDVPVYMVLKEKRLLILDNNLPKQEPFPGCTLDGSSIEPFFDLYRVIVG